MKCKLVVVGFGLSSINHSTSLFFFFFNDTATTEISPLPLHDALPISDLIRGYTAWSLINHECVAQVSNPAPLLDRKSTRLNSSHGYISYAVFCLKKKKRIQHQIILTQSKP